MLEKLGFHNAGTKQGFFNFIVNTNVQVKRVYSNKGVDEKVDTMEPIATGKNNKTGSDIKMYHIDTHNNAYDYVLSFEDEVVRFTIDKKGQLVWL